MSSVTVHIRWEQSLFRMAVCTSSGLQGHRKATLAREFVKWKAVAPVSTCIQEHVTYLWAYSGEVDLRCSDVNLKMLNSMDKRDFDGFGRML